jgi:catechol 2,3-dioxygenase-like lactoylglutathione lyase family enzyme
MTSRPPVRALGVNHVALEVDSVDAALEWWARFLRFELRGRRPAMAWIDLGDQFIALSEPRSQAADASRHFGLVVDDKEALRAALRAAELDSRPIDGGQKRIGMVRALDVSRPDDGDVAGHFETGFATGIDRPDGHGIVCREDGVRAPAQK